ncbi:MAG: response regulator transcription factor [Campylobacterota bacterium]
MDTKKYKNLSVLVVEDEKSARVEIVDLLGSYFGFVHSAEDGCKGLESVCKFHPDVIILDIQMPCMNGLDMMEEVNKIRSNSILLFTTAFNDARYLLSAIDLKADAYITKPINIDLLLEKIEKSLIGRTLDNPIGRGSGISSCELLHKNLSSREYEVCLDIAKGIKANAIAEKYNIKPKTVSTYRKRILGKMRLSSNAEIIRYAIAHGLI